MHYMYTLAIMHTDRMATDSMTTEINTVLIAVQQLSCATGFLFLILCVCVLLGPLTFLTVLSSSSSKPLSPLSYVLSITPSRVISLRNYTKLKPATFLTPNSA